MVFDKATVFYDTLAGPVKYENPKKRRVKILRKLTYVRIF